MGCASTTPMLVTDPQGCSGVLKAVESGARDVVDKAGEEVTEAATRIAGHASTELQEVLGNFQSSATDAAEMLPDMEAAIVDTEAAAEAELERLERAITPILDEMPGDSNMDAEQTEEMSAEQKEGDQQTMIESLEPTLTEIQEILPVPKDMDAADPAETAGVMADAEPSTQIDAEVMVTADTMMGTASDGVDPSSTKEMGDMSAAAASESPADPAPPPVPSAPDEEGDSSDIDFNMTLEDMEMLEAQLRALSTPPLVTSELAAMDSKTASV